MDDKPGPQHAAPRSRLPRRWFLAGGVALLAGAGAGVGADLRRKDPVVRPPLPPRPPAALVAAAHAERRLLADLRVTTGGPADVRAVVEQLKADHEAHLAALTALLARYRAPSSTPAAGGTPRTPAQLRTAEQRAASTAAAHAEALHGPQAALLASIAACEATHAELLA
jgi:hypothetical protein